MDYDDTNETTTKDYSYLYDVPYHEDEEYFVRVEELMWVIGGIILITVGTLGNLLSIAVLIRPSMRRSNAALYLTVLAFSDLGALYTGLLRRIIIYLGKYDVRELSEAGCKIHMTLVYFFLDFSSWLLVTLSLERLLSVCRPLTVKNTCTRRLSVLIICVMAVVLFALNSHFLFLQGEVTVTFGAVTRTFKCTALTDEYFLFFANVWPWVDLGVFALLPLLLQAIANTFIVRQVIISHSMPGGGARSRGNKARSKADNVESDMVSADSTATRNASNRSSENPGGPANVTVLNEQATRQEEQNGGQEMNDFSRGNANGTPAKYHAPRNGVAGKDSKSSPDRRGAAAALQDKQVYSMTVMLVVVSVTFCLTTIPVSVYLIYNFIALVYHPRMRAVWVAVNLAMYTNNACNFILYSLSGSRFRAELRTMWRSLRAKCCKKRRRRVHRPATVSTLASSQSSNQSHDQSYRSSATEGSSVSGETSMTSQN